MRERKVIGLYYYGEVTMKQIGAEIGVNESRVSQLHARAIRRLRDALGTWVRSRWPRCAARSSHPRMRKRSCMRRAPSNGGERHAVVLPYRRSVAQAARAHAQDPARATADR